MFTFSVLWLPNLFVCDVCIHNFYLARDIHTTTQPKKLFHSTNAAILLPPTSLTLRPSTNSMSDNLVVGQTNNSNNIGNNWRSNGSGGGSTAIMSSSSGVESTSSIQKRGAERLFQYMEADGSDPEDYTR